MKRVNMLKKCGLVALLFVGAFIVAFACSVFYKGTEYTIETTPFVFNHEQDQISMSFNEKEYVIRSDRLYLISDWSDDYSRVETGTAWRINHEQILFAGHLNHSRRSLFVYTIKDEQLECFENLVDFGIDQDVGWWAIKALPLYYTADDGIYPFTLVINGKDVGRFTSNGSHTVPRLITT